MLVVVDNRLRIPAGDLTPEAREALCTEFTYANPDAQKLKAFGFRRRVPKTIRTWGESPGWVSFPRGAMPRVRAVLRDAGLNWRVQDARAHVSSTTHGPRAVPGHLVKLRPFQEKMVRAAVERENCLWRCPQGGGKTTASIAFASRVGLPALFVVSSGELLNQWVRRCRKELDLEPGVLSGKKKRLADVTVAMQQTLRKRAASLRGVFGTVVCDEVQQFAASTFQDVIDQLDCRYRLGVSADERRSDGKEFLIHDQFGEVACEVKHDDLVDDGFILEVEIRVVPTTFRADWYVALDKVKQKVERYDDLLFAMEQDEARNEVTMWCVGECLADGEQAIVMSNRRDYCSEVDRRCVANGIRSGLLIGGEDYRGEFDDTLERMASGECRVGVGTLQAIGVGVDMPRIARGVIATPIANNQKGGPQFKQFRGRFARTCEGKRDAVLYYIYDPLVFGSRVVRHLCRWSKRVVVRRDGSWVDGRQYLKETRDEKPKGRDDDPTLEEVLGR